MSKPIILFMDVYDHELGQMVAHEAPGDTLEAAIAEARDKIANFEIVGDSVRYVMLENFDLLPFIRNKEDD